MLGISFLGQFEVQLDGGRLTISTRNAQALFAFLVLHARKAYRREQLAGILWPDSSEENARSNLRHELWRLRKTIETNGSSYFQADDLSIAFAPGSAYFLDVQRLESGSQKSSSIDELIQSISVYQGDLLPGFYDEWVFAERDRLHMLFEAKIARLLELLAADDRWTDVQEWALRWLAVEQWSEPAYRSLISAYANTGDIAKAAATYERLSQGLQKELGLGPSEQTQQLFQQIKQGWKAKLHREQQDSNLPPNPDPRKITTGPALPKVRRSNLPNPATSFIGREQEIKQVTHLFTRTRLISITGSGGVGKTRLAIQVAGALTALFRDGAWWVELASTFEPVLAWPAQPGALRTAGPPGQPPASPEPFHSAGGPEPVAQAVAKAMRIPGIPGRSQIEAIVEYLQEKELLLILDNCEHLITACAFLTERILADCPFVVILTTSREPLGIPGEVPWLLPSLSLPGKEQLKSLTNLSESEAVRLFLERAGAALPGFQPDPTDLPAIAHICKRLDGIPLAIELAAARANLLSIPEIAARLDNRFSLLSAGQRTALPRHQTLWEALEWSHALLSRPEQILFRRLSVFALSFTLGAVETICAADEISRQEALPLLGRLVNKSLVSVEASCSGTDLPTRYRMLDTICSFARLKLDEANETGWALERHANFYAHLAETAQPELLSHQAVHWHQLLQAENGNLNAAIEWCVETDQAENAFRIVGALMWFWFRSGSYRAGCDLTLKTLAAPSAMQLPQLRARALNVAGFLLCLLDETQAARRALEEALQILQTVDDAISRSGTLQFLGLVYSNEQKYDLADAAFQEGLAIIRNLENPLPNIFLFFYGDVDYLKGDRRRAQAKYTESLQILGGSDNLSFQAYPLRRLGYLALEDDDIPAATEYLFKSFAFNQETGDVPGLTASLISLAVLAIRLEKYLEATYIFGGVTKQLESLSINLLNLDQAEFNKIHGRLCATLDGEAFTSAFSTGWEMSLEDLLALIAKSFG